MPSLAALRRRNAIGIQSLGDCAESGALTTFSDDPLCDLRVEGARSSELDALGLLGGKCLLRALLNQAAFKLSEGGQDVRHRLSCRSRCVNGAVEGHKRPSLPL